MKNTPFKNTLIALSMTLPISAAIAASDKAPARTAADQCRALYEQKNYSAAIATCKKAAESDPQAQYLVGRMYEKGQGTEINMGVARGWYEKAAKANHAESQYRLAAAYRMGAAGLKQDDVKAVEWLKRSAENGYDRAQRYLAEGYERGLLGLPKDAELARKWRERADAPR